jgi:hypothetical protein
MATATANDRPLLVVHEEEEGHLVYDLLVQQHGEEEALACFPRPVAHFPAPLGCRALAVAGGTVLGAFYDFMNDTIGRHARLQDLPFNEWRYLGNDFRDAPAMLPMGDDRTVIRLDRVLFDGNYAFEALRLIPGGGGSFHATPLPQPPISYVFSNGGQEIVWVSAYFALGTRMWVSMLKKGTFSFDTCSGTWRKEGCWELPFEGRALYVPELASVVGLATKTGLLCAYDFAAGAPPVMRGVWRETYSEHCIYDASDRQQQPSKARDMHAPSLAYLGEGRFCICRPMSVMEPAPYGPPMRYNAASFLVAVLKRSHPSGKLQLVTCGKTTCMYFPKGQLSYIGFIQPAT